MDDAMRADWWTNGRCDGVLRTDVQQIDSMNVHPSCNLTNKLLSISLTTHQQHEIYHQFNLKIDQFGTNWSKIGDFRAF